MRKRKKRERERSERVDRERMQRPPRRNWTASEYHYSIALPHPASFLSPSPCSGHRTHPHIVILHILFFSLASSLSLSLSLVVPHALSLISSNLFLFSCSYVFLLSLLLLAILVAFSRARMLRIAMHMHGGKFTVMKKSLLKKAQYGVILSIVLQYFKGIICSRVVGLLQSSYKCDFLQ